MKKLEDEMAGYNVVTTPSFLTHLKASTMWVMSGELEKNKGLSFDPCGTPVVKVHMLSNKNLSSLQDETCCTGSIQTT